MTDDERDAMFRASDWRVTAYLYGTLKGAYGERIADRVLTEAFTLAHRREVPSESPA